MLYRLLKGLKINLQPVLGKVFDLQTTVEVTPVYFKQCRHCFCLCSSISSNCFVQGIHIE